MRARTRLLAGLCLVGVAGCGERGAPAGAAQRDTTPPEQQVVAPKQVENSLILAAAMVGLPAPMPMSQLPDSGSEGAKLVVTYCAQGCHGIPSPGAHSQTDWPVVLRRMWLRMDKIDTTYHVAVPTNAERVLIMDYLIAHSFQAASGLLPAAPGRELFVATCTQCHGLPDVRQHSAEDWVAVVRRMNGHMEQILGKVLSQDQMQRIVLYLDKASQSS
jgi:cytochrome c5